MRKGSSQLTRKACEGKKVARNTSFIGTNGNGSDDSIIENSPPQSATSLTEGGLMPWRTSHLKFCREPSQKRIDSGCLIIYQALSIKLCQK
jgi:hypothetical protein